MARHSISCLKKVRLLRKFYTNALKNSCLTEDKHEFNKIFYNPLTKEGFILNSMHFASTDIPIIKTVSDNAIAYHPFMQYYNPYFL